MILHCLVNIDIFRLEIKRDMLPRFSIYVLQQQSLKLFTSSRPEVFLRKAVLKICSKFTGEHPCRSVISVKLQSNFIEITLRYGCSPVHLLYIFRAHFSRNTSWWLLLTIKNLKMCYWISLDFIWLLVSWQLLGVWMKELNWSHLLFLFSFCSSSVILSNTTIDVHKHLVKYLH